MRSPEDISNELKWRTFLKSLDTLTKLVLHPTYINDNIAGYFCVFTLNSFSPDSFSPDSFSPELLEIETFVPCPGT